MLQIVSMNYQHRSCCTSSLLTTGAFAIFIQVGAIILLLGNGVTHILDWWERRKKRVQCTTSLLEPMAPPNEVVLVTVQTLPPDGSEDWASRRPNSSGVGSLKSHYHYRQPATGQATTRRR